MAVDGIWRGGMCFGMVGTGDTGDRHTRGRGGGRPCTGMWGQLRHGDSSIPGCRDVGVAGRWEQWYPGVWGQPRLGTLGMAGTWGQPCFGTATPGMWGWLGQGDSHAQGCEGGWDTGTAGTQGQLGLGDSHTRGSWGGWDTGTAMLRGMGTARTWGQPRDVETIGIRGQPHLGTQGQLYSGMLCMGTWE